MSLDGVRVEDLHDLGKVHALHKIVDLLIVVVVAEDDKSVLNVSSLRQTHYQVPQVHQPSVDLSARVYTSHNREFSTITIVIPLETLSLLFLLL